MIRCESAPVSTAACVPPSHSLVRDVQGQRAPRDVQSCSCDHSRRREAHGGGQSGGLVANGEAIPAVLGVLEFVDEGDRVVLEGNTAVALCVDNQGVFAQAEFTRALAQKIRPG